MAEALREWALEKSALHHRLAHDNKHLRTEHIASSAAYRELASEIEARALTGGVTQADVGVTALIEAGNTLLRVGDDKLATRREWFEAVSGWRDTLAMLRVSQDGGGE